MYESGATLKEIKEQGGKITLQLDINKRYRFCAYNKQFMIPLEDVIAAKEARKQALKDKRAARKSAKK